MTDNLIGRYAKIINDSVVIYEDNILTWASTAADKNEKHEARRQRKTAVEIISPTYKNRRMTVRVPMPNIIRRLEFVELQVFYEDLELLPIGIREIPEKPKRVKVKKTKEGEKMTDIKGYKILTDQQKEHINGLKNLEKTVLEYIKALNDEATDINYTVNKRWLSIAATDLEQGFMAIVRAIAQPETVTII